MTRLVISTLLFLFIAAPAFAQLGAPQGDFRVDGRPGTAPTIGPPGGPSLPAGPTLFRNPTGTKDPQDVLDQLNKQLGARTGVEGISSGAKMFDLPRDLGGSSSIGSRPLSQDPFKR